MAKSIRSKRKQKMRNEKRKKNAPKEMARLLKCVAEGMKSGKDVEMEELVTVKDGKELVEEKNAEEQMEAKSSSKARKRLMDKNGHYPVWVPQRRIKALRRKRLSKKKGKKRGSK